MERKVCERYRTGQPCFERLTIRYVQFISKLDRKLYRMLIGLLACILTHSIRCTDEESKNSRMQKMWRRKRNVS